MGERKVDDLYPEERKIAFVSQRSALFPHLSVQENLGFSLRVQKVDEKTRKEKVEQWLKKLQIVELRDRLPKDISGGEAQRVALGRAFISAFPALLLDEPYASLDPPLRKELRQWTRSLITETKMSALLVTHDPQDVLELCDRVGFLDNGVLKVIAKRSELRDIREPIVREMMGELQ